MPGETSNGVLSPYVERRYKDRVETLKIVISNLEESIDIQDEVLAMPMASNREKLVALNKKIEVQISLTKYQDELALLQQVDTSNVKGVESALSSGTTDELSVEEQQALLDQFKEKASDYNLPSTETDAYLVELKNYFNLVNTNAAKRSIRQALQG